MTEAEQRQPSAGVSRRMMLRGATVSGVALPLLAACGAGDSGSRGGGGGAGGGGAGGASVAAADVPVGGGIILKDQQVVVTQPAKGEFKAFTAVCTHQGCTVGKVEKGQIVCPCHGSHFSIKDGSPTSGPAPSALAGKSVSVKGGQISVV